MTNPKALLDAHGVSPKKSLGQNFLHDPNVLEKIATIAELMPDDLVVEIGPGTGALTRVLSQAARHVISIEIDERLRPILAAEFADQPHVIFVFDDVLKVDLLSLVGPKDFVVVANVPYYITSQILRHLLETHRRPSRIVLTVQLELAERVIARPGDMSLLAVSVQYYGKPQIAARLKPAVFWPRPDVDSAVLRIDTYDKPPVDAPDHATFFRVARAGFGQKRKQIKNSLAAGLSLRAETVAAMLNDAGVDGQRRAETLTLDEWAALARAYARHKSGR